MAAQKAGATSAAAERGPPAYALMMRYCHRAAPSIDRVPPGGYHETPNAAAIAARTIRAISSVG